MSAIQTLPPRHVTVARNSVDVEKLRKIWSELPRTHVDADIDHFLTVVKGSPSVVRPHVLHILGDNRDLIVVARLANHSFSLTAGYTTVASTIAPALVVSFGGILGAHTVQDYQYALAVLRDQAKDEADAIVFQKVDTSSMLFEHLHRCGHRALRLTRPSVSTWSTELPTSWEALLAKRSSKSRRQLRYDDNRLRRTYDERLKLRRLDSDEHRLRLLVDLRTVASASYQSNLKVSVLDDPLQFALISAARSTRSLRVWMLYIDEEPVAFWWGVIHGGTLIIGSPGFRPEYTKERVGYFTFRRMIEDACADPAISHIEYGPGEADYKKRFATHRAEVADVILFEARARSLVLKGLLGLDDAVRMVGQRAVQRAGRTRELKQRLRLKATSRKDQHA